MLPYMNPITDPLRRAIEKSGESMLGLEKRTGVTRQVIMAFMAGGGLRLSNADRLAAYFGLKLVSGKRPKAR